MQTLEPSPPIGAPQVTLRAPRLDDAARVAHLVNDFEVARMTTGIPHPYDRADAEAFLARAAATDLAQEASFAIDCADDGLVGLIGLYPSGALGPELGYWVGRPFWGRGIATQAVLALLSWARSVRKRRLLMSGHFVDNPASGRVLEKAGFLYTGEVLPRHSAARGEAAPTRMMVWLA